MRDDYSEEFKKARGPGRKPHDYKIRQGGLMRCCLDRGTHEKDPKHQWPAFPEDGDRLECPHGCGPTIVFDGEMNAMRWVGPDDEIYKR